MITTCMIQQGFIRNGPQKFFKCFQVTGPADLVAVSILKNKVSETQVVCQKILNVMIKAFGFFMDEQRFILFGHISVHIISRLEYSRQIFQFFVCQF